MRRVVLLGLAATWLSAVPTAPAGPEITAASINERGRLVGATRVRYLVRQLDLTEEQAVHVQGLFDSVFTSAPEADTGPDVAAQVRDLYSQINKAKEAGDQDKVNQLMEQLQQLGKETRTSSDFFENLESQLTDEQKKKLEQARARLERTPSGALRPIDLIRIAQGFDLTEEQQEKLQLAHGGTRKLLGSSLRPTVELKLKMINFLADEIRALLTPDQVEAFELRVRAIRPDLADGELRVRMPADDSEAPAAEEAAP